MSGYDAETLISDFSFERKGVRLDGGWGPQMQTDGRAGFNWKWLFILGEVITEAEADT